MRRLAKFLSAEQLIEYIAYAYVELSQDKVRGQRDEWNTLCRDWIKARRKEEEE